MISFATWIISFSDIIKVLVQQISVLLTFKKIYNNCKLTWSCGCLKTIAIIRLFFQVFETELMNCLFYTAA